MSKQHWALIPWLNRFDLTKQAALDLLAQEGLEGELRVLLIANGANDSDREACRRFTEENYPRVWSWIWNPAALSLSSCWNRGLDMFWELGAEEAMVCNNDLQLQRSTYRQLLQALQEQGALFVSGVGVTEEQFLGVAQAQLASRGGPDFSCYLIKKDCHQRYRFDEGFQPAFCEDLDLHRRMMLGGDGQRIFSVNVPYLHLDRGSNTLKSLPPEQREKLERRISEGSRAHYARKWGGEANHERFLVPFAPRCPMGGGPCVHPDDYPCECPCHTTESDHATTPELFEKERDKWTSSE